MLKIRVFLEDLKVKSYFERNWVFIFRKTLHKNLASTLHANACWQLEFFIRVFQSLHELGNLRNQTGLKATGT